MKPALHILSLLKTAVLVSLCMALVTACAKKCDDNAAPAVENEGAARKGSEDTHTSADLDTDRPAGTTLRSGEDLSGNGAGGPEGDGISDDGDDEADGEGSNKKLRQQQ